jgi:hypothetical protein
MKRLREATGFVTLVMPSSPHEKPNARGERRMLRQAAGMFPGFSGDFVAESQTVARIYWGDW